MDKTARQQSCLVVMAKAPIPGQVKTRLACRMGKLRAARIYKQLLHDTLHQLSGLGMQRVLSCDPYTRNATLTRLANAYGWRRIPQARGDLGVRMSDIISRYQLQYDHVIITGSDLANISVDFVNDCHQQLLDGCQLVLGATEDGGYGLIGMHRQHAGLFRDIPWSTGRVLDITLKRARRLGLQTAVVCGLQDIDTYRDYREWQQSNQEKAWVV